MECHEERRLHKYFMSHIQITRRIMKMEVVASHEKEMIKKDIHLSLWTGV